MILIFKKEMIIKEMYTEKDDQSPPPHLSSGLPSVQCIQVVDGPQGWGTRMSHDPEHMEVMT